MSLSPLAAARMYSQRITLIVKQWGVRTELFVALLNLTTAAGGFLLQVIVLRMVGASREADTYFATAAIPQLVLSISAHVVTGALIPQLARTGSGDRAAAVRTMLAFVILGGAPIALVLYLTAHTWTLLVFPGFAGNEASTGIALAKLAALAIPFTVASSILSGYLYAERRFLISESVALGVTMASAIAAALLIPTYGIVVLGWIFLVRAAVHFIALGVLIPAGGFRAGLRVVKPIMSRARALLVGAIYFKSDILVDRFLLSLAPAGALSIVVFGQSLYVIAAGVLGQALANTATPTLSVAHHELDGKRFLATLKRNLVIISLTSTLFVVLSVAVVPPVLSVITDRATAQGAVYLRTVLLLFTGLPIAACIGALIANAFYAMGDTRTPTLMSTATFTIFIALKIVVFNRIGLYAFCALTSLYYITNCTLMTWLLHRRITREFST